MATSYTENFSFPLLESGSGGWDATINGMLVDMDRLMAEARNPLIWENDNDNEDHLLLNVTGRESTSEILSYDGELLLYA